MIKYIFLGIIQGLTEFLPVSSSAHLIIFQKILNMGGEELALTVFLHLGTLLALVVFFFKDIIEAARSFRTLFFIATVTVITGAIAISGRDFFEALFNSAKYAAVALFITGIILLATKRMRDKARRDILDIKDALILGVAQGVAVIPGISRSGLTISSLLFRKIDPETCFKFSFLAGIPAIAGAALLEAKKINFAMSVSAGNFIAGFIASFLTGLVALWLVRSAVQKAKLHYFGYYCIIVSILTLLFIK